MSNKRKGQDMTKKNIKNILEMTAFIWGFVLIVIVILFIIITVIRLVLSCQMLSLILLFGIIICMPKILIEISKLLDDNKIN